MMVAKAKEELEQEAFVKEEEKQNYLSERAPALRTSGLSLAQLQVTHKSNTHQSKCSTSAHSIELKEFKAPQFLCTEDITDDAL